MGKQLGKQDLDGFSFQADIFIRILGRFRNVNSSILLSVVSQDKKRFSHKDLLTLHQSLTSLRIMAKLNRLKAVLAEQDKTSKWLAEQVGKSACTVSKWCNNVVQPDLNTLDKIAKLLDVDVKDLLNSTEK